MSRTLASILAATVDARLTCLKTGNDWADKHTGMLVYLVREFMPSGSGIDTGMEIDLAKSTGERLVFHTAFHHMDEHGSYAGWTEHTVTVRASLFLGLVITVSGRDQNDIKDYLADVFHTALDQLLIPDYENKTYKLAA